MNNFKQLQKESLKKQIDIFRKNPEDSNSRISKRKVLFNLKAFLELIIQLLVLIDEL